MQVEFMGSYAGGRLPRHGYPEIAVGGRSNVGKSSFINAVLARRGAARVSARPGKTQTINLFLCDRRFVLTDLPGFGYARAPKAEQKRWARDLDAYFSHGDTLRATILLMDLRRLPLEADMEALDWFAGLEKPVLVVLTKADKLKRAELSRAEREIAGWSWPGGSKQVIFSARTGRGRKEVLEWIDRIVKG
jgi:GTP-binding protein